tara:strand:- start:784 stop:975 length:192 start_codon:yes stop_codon:yes gene_type:complete
MPFRIDKTKQGKYRLFNLHKEQYAKPTFNTRQGAINSGMNFMRYRHETPILKGNKILNKKKLK